MNNGYENWYLTVGECKHEVMERETKMLLDKGVNLFGISVKEISEVDGFKINLNKTNA